MNIDENKERLEAIRAGERARQSLQDALDELDSARNWGIYDILGGRFLSTMIKHSKMNKASEHIEQAKDDLRRFSRELKDVRQYADVDLSTGDYWGIADYVFDGILSDWIMQNRINEARSQIQSAIRQIEAVLESLK